MRMRRRQFRIGEMAKQLEIERFIIRFWEKEFNLKPNRSIGRQRYYDEEDLQRFQAIKTLLYKRGFTIAGARKELENIKSPALIIKGQDQKPAEQERIADLKKQLRDQQKQFENQISHLKDELRRLKEASS